jgi:phosphoglucomutase
MIPKNEINATFDKMILSASGWRGVFANSEESSADEISAVHKIISGAAAFVFKNYLSSRFSAYDSQLSILLGTDTRPTGRSAAGAMIPVLLSSGCDVRYAGVTAAPEIMAWAKSLTSPDRSVKPVRADNVITGFIYISASHNPIGHNGFKFGLTDGGVLPAEEAAKLTADFRLFMKRDDCIEKIEALISAASKERLNKVYAGVEDTKTEAGKAYYDFCGEVVWGNNAGIKSSVYAGLKKQSIGIVCDFNGSARTLSADKEFFSSLGLKFEYINGEPGQIVHCIVPEGESLEPCRVLLEQAYKRDSSFILGYVPDCDGDRGNLVIWDDLICKARSLEAQEVFALACTAEFSHLVWTEEIVPRESCDSGGKTFSKAAIVINDPTSMRIDRIAEAFGISVFRAEVGEANVVNLARHLREEGYIVRILGEGSAGGNITHPSAVRDPVSTVIAIVKLLSIRSNADKPGLFEIWCKLSGQVEKYHNNFTLADIIASLPQFTTTPAYNDDAILHIKTQEHAILKSRYHKIFLREWKERKEQLKAKYGFCGWEAIGYNGLEEKRCLTNFEEAGKGGLKILFLDSKGNGCAYIWMRGSATEPVFRIIADVENANKQAERDLLNWQRSMIIESDKE